MATRRILNEKTDNETLRRKCRTVDVVDERIRTLLDDLAQTMYEANGVGLAAPQVTYVIHNLKERGFDVSPDATTIEEAADEIMKRFEGTGNGK